jgi:regulatory protein
MRSAPREISDEGELYNAALRALMRRAYSVHEMNSYLERRSGQPALARRLVSRLKGEKLIDDARYALEFARQHARLRRQGRHRITRELRTRGVPDRHIESAIAQTFAETDEALLAQKLIERKLRNLRRSAPIEQRQTASLYRMLLRAGFDSELIRRQLRVSLAAHAAAAPELPEDDSGGEA